MALKCDFCEKLQEQVGQLSCKHHICATCFRCLSEITEKCYLCISNVARLSRTNMRVIFDKSDVNMCSTLKSHGDAETENAPLKSYLFCANDECDFMGTRQELASHSLHCKFQPLSEYPSLHPEDTEFVVNPSIENAANASRELSIVRLYKQMANMSRQMDLISKQLGYHSEGVAHKMTQVEDNSPPLRTDEGQPVGKSGTGCFEKVAAVVIFALVLQWYIVNQDSSSIVTGDERPSTVNTVTFTFTNVDEVITKARFNKRDMLLSAEKLLDRYKVKLGFGGSLSTSRTEVSIWVCAEVFRDAHNEWPVNSTMRLSLEHSDESRSLFYDFLPSHTGMWKESPRVHKSRLLIRQMQVETTDQRKYLRFSCALNYEEALRVGYIVNDSVTVRLDVIA